MPVIKSKKSFYLQWDSNPRPFDYEANTLPLSYWLGRDLDKKIRNVVNVTFSPYFIKFNSYNLLLSKCIQCGMYLLGLLNFRQPDLALIYVIKLSSGSPKIPISVFYHLLLTHFLSLEALQLAGLSARALGPASWRASRLKKWVRSKW